MLPALPNLPLKLLVLGFEAILEACGDPMSRSRRKCAKTFYTGGPRYKHIVRARGNMLVTYILLDQEKISKYVQMQHGVKIGCGIGWLDIHGDN